MDGMTNCSNASSAKLFWSISIYKTNDQGDWSTNIKKMPQVLVVNLGRNENPWLYGQICGVGRVRAENDRYSVVQYERLEHRVFRSGLQLRMARFCG